MLEPSVPYQPSEADLEMIVEETTGKTVKRTDAVAGVASMRQRIMQLEQEKTGLILQMDAATGAFEQSLNNLLASINHNIATARECLAHFETQLGKRN